MNEERHVRDRREQEKAWGDAVFDVWMAGGNPDAVSREDVADVYYNEGGYDRYDTADIVTRRTMRRNRSER